MIAASVLLVLAVVGVAIVVVSGPEQSEPTIVPPTPARDPAVVAAAELARVRGAASPILARLREIAAKAPSLPLTRPPAPLELKSLSENFDIHEDAYIVGDDVPIDRPSGSWTDRFWPTGRFAHIFELLAGTARPFGFELQNALSDLQYVDYVVLVHSRERIAPKIVSGDSFARGTVRADVRIFRLRDASYVGGVSIDATSSDRVVVEDRLTELEKDLRAMTRIALRESLLKPTP